MSDTTTIWSLERGLILGLILGCMAMFGCGELSLDDCVDSQCDQPSVEQPSAVSGVVILGSKTELAEGQTRQFQATVEGRGNDQQSVDWSVNIGSIDEDGLYTADGGMGTVTVTATATQDDSVSNTIQFSVIEATDDPIPNAVLSVSIDQPDANVWLDRSRALSVKVETSGNADAGVLWSSDDTSVATVDAQGSVTGVSPGSFTITATSMVDSSKTDRVDGVVKQALEGSRQRDEEILQEIAGMWGITGLQGWKTSGMSLSDDIDGITAETIDGELRVVELNLKDKGIEHSNGLPDSLEELTEMHTFNIRFNYMTGPLRSGIFRHQRLEKCYINHPGYYKDDPHEVAARGGGNVNNGKRARSSPSGVSGSGPWNNMHGPITDFDMPELEWFYLTWMSVGGTIPSGFWNSKKLKGFGWGETELDMQTLPDDAFEGMYQLDQFLLSLEGRRGSRTPFIQGQIPSSLNSVGGTLRYMGFGGQNFDSLPADMSNLTKIGNIAFSGSNISGEVPAEWLDGTYENIRSITINFNDFSGPLPQQGMPNSLQVLTVNGNNLSGRIPQGIWKLRSFINSDFSNNNFTGRIVDDADLTDFSQNFWKIRNMRFSNNQLEGPWPKMDWLTPSNLKDFTRTDYNGNKFKEADWNMVDEGREYVFKSDGSFDLDASDSGPIVRKTRLEWYHYHCHPDGGSGKGLSFKYGNQNPD